MQRPLLIISRSLFLVTLAAVTYFSLAPAPVAGPGRWDKAAHLVAYGVLGFLMVLAMPPRWKGLQRTLVAVVAVVAYGIALEFVQRVTGRQFEVADMVADAIGAGLGAVSGWLVSRKLAG